MGRDGEPKVRKRLLADIRPLRESPALRRYWAGSALSSIGNQMAAFALSLQVYQLTHSSAAVGALALTSALPIFVIGLVGGSLTDAADRRRLVLVTSSCLTAVSALVALQAFLDLRQLWLLYLLSTARALFGAIDIPARRTFLPRLLPADQLPAANALFMLVFTVSFTIGPPLAGLLTAAGGLKFCYFVDALSFAATLYGVARLPSMPPQGRAARPGFKAVAEGLRFIRHHPILTGAFLADMNATVLGMPAAVLPAFNAEHFGGAAQSLGLLMAAPAIGGLLGTTLSGPVSRVTRQGRTMLITVSIWGAAIAVFGLSSTLWLCVLLLAVAGLADSASVILRTSMVLTVTPDRLRGRITAADYVVGGGAPQVGNLEAGVVASLTSPGFSAFSGGIATVIGAAVIRLAVPAFAKYDSSTEPDKTWGSRLS
ncbi:MAG: hypothetical protein JWQ81_4282 [Amycolatopsis sp.]|nr:hypothetical protein [Amycolatopsis sp.]